MKIHEHQAKDLFSRYGIPVPEGRVAHDPAEARAIAESLGGERWVVKAQIHAGGRGKGGGVKLVGSLDGVQAEAERLIGSPLVTPQTGPAGKVVHEVLVERAVAFHRELYLGMTVDRGAGRIAVMASAAGGMDIEEVAATDPGAIHKVHVDPLTGLARFQATWLGVKLGLEGGGLRSFVGLATNLYRLFVETDASLAEINPLVVLEDGTLLALDAKLNLDSSGLPRHRDLAELADPREEDPLELDAAKAGLSYVSLDGEVGCMVNGAGLAMATMDLILHQGAAPANFLDVGGAADSARVAKAMDLILGDPRVECVFVNIFGGIVRCDVVATGIVEATKHREIGVPLVVRLVGTNEREGREILANSGLEVVSVDTMAEGAAAVREALGL